MGMLFAECMSPVLARFDRCWGASKCPLWGYSARRQSCRQGGAPTMPTAYKLAALHLATRPDHHTTEVTLQSNLSDLVARETRLTLKEP